MQREINTMTPEPNALISTYIWLAVFGIACAVFFGLAVWIIIRGGKDVLEMMSFTEKKKK